MMKTTLRAMTKAVTKLALWRHACQGTAAIEFAIIAPLFIVLILGIVELGFAAYQAQQVQSAAEAGILYAAKRGFDLNGITQAIRGATDANGISAMPVPVQFCGCPTATGIAATDCTVSCADGSPAGQYVQAGAAVTRRSLLPTGTWPLPDTLSAQAIVRVR